LIKQTTRRYVEALIVEFDWKVASECAALFPLLLSSFLGYPYGQVRLAAAGVLFRIISLAKAAPNFSMVLRCLEGEEDAAAVSRKRETVLMLLSMAVRAQNKQLASFYGSLLDFVFAAHLDPDKDVSKLAKSLTATQALGLFSVAVLAEIRAALARIAQSSSWKQRAAIPLVVTLLDFNHRFVAHDDSFFLPLVLSLLKDAHVEVRQVAELALRSILTGQIDERKVEVLEKEFQSMTPHAVALGYSAVVLSCPYTVPAFVAPVLRKLIAMASAAPPVSTTVQSTIAEFRRTHRDAAEEDEGEQRTQMILVLFLTL
jgi:hypothetical protein